MKITKAKLKRALLNATSCAVQHDGWTCGTCFFAMHPKLDNSHWQAVLLTRGDYKLNDLDNLPDSIYDALNEIVTIAESKI